MNRKFTNRKSSWLWGAPILLGLSLLAGPALSAQQAAADNTKQNQGDANQGATTADQQKMNTADRNLTEADSRFDLQRQIAFYLRAQHQDHFSRRQSHTEGARPFRR